MVQIFYGAAAGIPAQPRYQNLHQDTDTIQNTVEGDDRFGAAVVVLRAAPRRVYLPLVTKGL
jgi:hypothetical protein